MSDAIRIAMWSGPRNISTAMMRSFENRPDTSVIDEPFYAAYLAQTGLDHPMRDEILSAAPIDWHTVAATLVGPVPRGRRIFYQKHMTHHMLPGVDLGWMDACRHAFLIRAPERVLASYTAKRGTVLLEDIGFVRQRELFDREADRGGQAPPVLDADDVLGNPHAALTWLCARLDIPFTEHMLHWPAGRRDSDGVWAPVWYDAVEKSTGFAAGRDPAPLPALGDEIQAIADAARPHYEHLARFRPALG
jgi:hypothetical protein